MRRFFATGRALCNHLVLLEQCGEALLAAAASVESALIVVCLIARILLIVICQRVLSDKLSRFSSDPRQRRSRDPLETVMGS